MRIHAPVVKQVGPVDCGPACVASVLEFHGKLKADEGTVIQLRSDLLTTSSGTSACAIENFLRTRYKMRMVSGEMTIPMLRWLEKQGAATIAAVNDHWVVVYSVGAKVVHYMDPAFGMSKLPHDDWLRWWNDMAGGRLGDVYRQFGIAVLGGS